ncbi:metal ABC transporter ATP-binding protein [Oerskovia sp. Sa1BUA8]|uniref:Metal ABC transporter ATP-binding protein n=1 Tax=Oerskovia douganii TaxID=2762210 RepID=A0A9D5U8T9_9CELL|nr:metal ABC transporter ATP-binding protein [Oerskovia douganii]MBE7699914.1 metal ABC transporter ATP-binding protein [Oerskovia douganii]
MSGGRAVPGAPAAGTPAAAVAAPALHVSGLTVRYREVLALEDVALTLAPGTVTGLIGANGSGKSTLFRSVMGMTRGTGVTWTGDVRVYGRDADAARKDGLVGYVPQSEDVDWAFPVDVRDVVTMGRYGGMGPTRRVRAQDRRAVADALDRVGLADLAHRQIGRLSGGQRKRVFVARAIAQGARLLLLDEPFAGVDKVSEAQITAVLRGLAASGCAVLVSTHDLTSLPDLVDDAILLQRRVILTGPPDVVLRPENLARTFGIDPLAASRGEDGAGAARTPHGSATTEGATR